MNLAEKFNHDFEKGDFSLYDSNGNRIYWEISEGFWWKSEYDSNGKEIYYVDSDGYWFKEEFDSNGSSIYYEESDRGVAYDYRPTTPCNGKIVEIDGKKYELKEV